MLLALSNNSIDVVNLIEPFVTRAVDQGSSLIWKGAEEVYPNAARALLFYGPHFVADKPDAANRFMVAYLQGARDYMDAIETGRNRDAVIATLIEYTDVKDPSVYDRMIPAAIDRNGAFDERDLEAQQDYYIETGQQQQRADMQQAVDNHYREFAIGVLGRAP